MTVLSRAVNVVDTATRLDSISDRYGQHIAAYNNGAGTIWVGGSDVTTANGIPVPPLSWSPAFEISTPEGLYGITTAAGTIDTRVIEQGV